MTLYQVPSDSPLTQMEKVVCGLFCPSKHVIFRTWCHSLDLTKSYPPPPLKLPPLFRPGKLPNSAPCLRTQLARSSTPLARSTTPFSTPSLSFPITTSSSSLLSFPATKKKTHRKKPLLFLASSTRTGSSTPNTTPSPSAAPDRVLQVHSPAEFDSALAAAKDRLVVVEYAASHSPRSRQIYPVMVELSRTCSDMDFLQVMGDESEATCELCLREGFHCVPHFSFYKSMQRLHDEEGVAPEQLRGDVLYYGDNHSLVVQLHSREDVDALIEKEKGATGRLVVLDVGLKHCGPCVKVYPTVMKLSRSMEDMVVFARMNGDENESCMGFLKDMEVVEVPTFLFIRDGEICGRYVGSVKGELIGEILRYQGIKIT